MKARALRSPEWFLIVYFAYVAAISPAFPLRPHDQLWPWAVAVFVPAMFYLLALGEARWRPLLCSVTRDWVPLGLTLLAYREMNWFSPAAFDHRLENAWVAWDRSLLHGMGVQKALEALGTLIPGYLEFCYLLVYAVGPFTVAVLYFEQRRDLVSKVLMVYLIGTLFSYALFPYFPSEPPRTVFAGVDLPNIVTDLRRFNLWIVGGYGIHSSVFPSAHVSSAFSAAWGLLLYLPRRRAISWGMLVYAISVALATVYGRYHYAADALAGIGISLLAGGIAWAAEKRRSAFLGN